MQEFILILSATIPVFLIVGIGYLTRWLGWVNDEAEKSIMRLILNVLYPCFVLSKVPGNENLKSVSLVLATIGIGFGLTILAFAIAYLTGKGLKLRSEDGLNTFCVATGIQNYGFIPIALVEALFSSVTLGVLFIFMLGLELAMWTVGIVLLSGSMAGAGKRLINGPMIAICTGLLLNFSGLYQWIPELVNKPMVELGKCSVPISLLLVGATLAGVIEREKFQLDWRVVGGSLLVRFGIMPIFFLMLACWCISSEELHKVLVLESAMPAAIFPVVLAKHFGGKPAVAVKVAIATSILSLIATPLILLLGFRLLGIAIE